MVTSRRARIIVGSIPTTLRHFQTMLTNFALPQKQKNGKWSLMLVGTPSNGRWCIKIYDLELEEVIQLLGN